MDERVASAAEQVKKGLESHDSGARDRFLEFVRRFSSDSAREREAVFACIELSAAGDGARDAASRKLVEIVERVVADYSSEKLRKRDAQRRARDYAVSAQFLERKEVAYRCSGLTKRYDSGFELGPIDLEISRGDITGVVGENGNGKTTLFRLIAGDLERDGGTVEYPFLNGSSGSRVDWRRVKSHIAYVPQELLPWGGRLRETLQYAAAVHGVRGKDNDREVRYVIERLALHEHLDKRWSQLSGGYKFRFELARALVWQPDVMVLDEPLANLDVNAQLALLRDIKAMATSVTHPIAVFMSSQHLDEIEAIADHLVFLDRGRPLFNGRRDRLGDDRAVNVFEVGCGVDMEELREAVPRQHLVSLTHDGFNFVLTVDLAKSARDVLASLAGAGIEVHFFRDISRSTRNIFRSVA